MIDLIPVEIKIGKVSFVNDIAIENEKKSIELKIKTQFSSVVMYDKDNNKCKCITTAELKPEELDVNFNVSISVSGIFTCNEIKDRKELHIVACKKLFPYVQTSITSFMTLVGFPNFLVEEPEVDISEVKENN